VSPKVGLTKTIFGVEMGESESQKIIQFFDGLGVPFEIIEHEPVHTSEDAARVRGNKPEEGVKALVFKTKENNFVLACVPGNSKINTKELAKILSTKSVYLASPEEVLEQTGCEIGSVSPLGNLFGLKTFFASSILDNEKVEFNIGLLTKSIRMTPQNLASAVGAEIVKIAK